MIETTPSRPRRYHLARVWDAGSVPENTTINRGSDSLRALFLPDAPEPRGVRLRVRRVLVEW
jgi:hypothetical protein